MPEKLGSKKYAAPVAAALAIACVMSFMFYPIANMEMKELPFAVLSLDEGVETPQGIVSAGDAIIENLLEASGENDEGSSPIAWTHVGSQEELDKAFDNGEFYGALIIPAGFSADQVAAKQAEAQATLAQAQELQAAAEAQAAAQGGQGEPSDSQAVGTQKQAAQGEGVAQGSQDEGNDLANGASSEGLTGEVSGSVAEAPSISVIIDNAKSPLVASQMKANIAAMFQQMGVNVDVETIHEGALGSSAEEDAAANPIAGMMSMQLSVMPLFVMSMVGAIVLSRVFKAKPGASSAERWKSLGAQTAYAAAVSLVASVCVYCMLLWVAGIEPPAVSFVLFAWLASFCIMLLFVGAFNLSFGLGALIAVCALAGGMMCGALPYEALPVFWQDWVYPWVPQRFIGEGVRAVLYLDAGPWNAGSAPLLGVAAVGAVLAAVAGLLPGKKPA